MPLCGWITPSRSAQDPEISANLQLAGLQQMIVDKWLWDCAESERLLGLLSLLGE